MEGQMSRGMPSMIALLGLLAVAGYQHRDKISEMLNGAGGKDGVLGKLGGMLGGTGEVVSGGLGEMVDRFKKNGVGDTADSWVTTGPNQSVTPEQLERALGPDTIDALTKQTGLSRDDILARLSRTLPEAVDKYTPDGRIPAA
jgi:uncharacterized protein YidB (DUF937 family)